MSTNYDGLTRNTWTGTWSPTGNHPIVLDTEIRGSLQSVTGSFGNRLTNITGQRLTEGMLVYVKTEYTAGGFTRTGDSYYKYSLLSGQSRDSITGEMPNAEENWTKFTVSAKIDKLSDIGDVNATDPIAQDSLLKYNSVTGKWDTSSELDGGAF